MICNNVNNISFIGMAGVGKSYFSNKLINFGYEHIKVDELITNLANLKGVNKETISDSEFIKLEEQAILNLKEVSESAIDTGGSVIYSNEAMELLKEISVVVYLKDSLENIKKRFDVRGEPHLIGIEGKTFEELFQERSEQYQKYADVIIDVTKISDIEEILSIIGSKSQK
ncbi:TPA: shikimate kinase [candidate division CPR2 bacterium]|uniref:Shikimate kinase n=1 Tax=candidate division CPR2 bacterium GW2011_GWC1_41_48 TaxID=1618344 RepID=A0A0G0YJS7_UNCC2|nr:MAG: Shikimate kinase [candidate division CPR2 bacterium GW2011_GWC2_39_35]KKR28525.1 MAG: Shikimate kinase [candidate division CPR2 bacterium GW2011_GWD1_39_7]KKR28708.1 MAG: Shikimate kinase [candidate division CPR2 bacterium GW2011_GWD2_39_7]KKS09786.1 MAG: Shikimate kinase [candidate division CPR2 bacterium GW2011_GWC1_41_48]OGB60990.1 MAG: hypothetical protein A2Y27_03455 [candidate division CPR2 bacterium GWD1_39_7]OGB73063.1 MAG: hypothetical protein A2Y26_02975 [candidate division C